MNVAIIKITNCHECKYCDHNGMLQSHPKYICSNKLVYGRGKVDTKYWYDQPILANVNSTTGMQIDVPNWCPFKETI